MYNKMPILAWNKDGAHYRFDSKVAAAKGLGVSLTMINARLKDHRPVVKHPGDRGIYLAKGRIE